MAQRASFGSSLLVEWLTLTATFRMQCPNVTLARGHLEPAKSCRANQSKVELSVSGSGYGVYPRIISRIMNHTVS